MCVRVRSHYEQLSRKHERNTSVLFHLCLLQEMRCMNMSSDIVFTDQTEKKPKKAVSSTTGFFHVLQVPDHNRHRHGILTLDFFVSRLLPSENIRAGYVYRKWHHISKLNLDISTHTPCHTYLFIIIHRSKIKVKGLFPKQVSLFKVSPLRKQLLPKRTRDHKQHWQPARWFQPLVLSGASKYSGARSNIT